MFISSAKPKKVWTVAEAKARLSEVLRRAEEEPQHIGAKNPFVVVPAQLWRSLTEPAKPRKPLGLWLIDNIPHEISLEIPSRKESDRDIPFIDERD